VGAADPPARVGVVGDFYGRMCNEENDGTPVHHTVPLHADPPDVLFCTRCGLAFVSDPYARQGYVPAPHMRRRLK
jgi:hypothetical protein